MSPVTARFSFRALIIGALACALVAPVEAKTRKASRKAPKQAVQNIAIPPGPPVPPRNARPLVVIDYKSGEIIEAVNPFTPWHPASLTKMMTTYVALQAIKARRLSKDTLLSVSSYAASQKPAKMAFAPGTRITLESALYILFVKSANDVAVTVAEGVSGSVPAFADEMNAWSRRLGMIGSLWRNPNGWHDDGQYTTARDLAVLARALYRDFPEYSYIFRAQAIQYGEYTLRNFNPLIGRFAGADGLKTGFTCPSGFNLVGSATRGGERHIAVVLGEISGKARGEKAALLLERSFAGPRVDGRPRIEALGKPDNVLTSPPNLRQDVCGGRHAPSEADDTAPAGQVLAFAPAANGETNGPAAAATASGEKADLILPPPPHVTAVVLARSLVDPKDKQPLTVAVAGTAEVGAGLTLPPIALLPAEIRSSGTDAIAVIRQTAPDGARPVIGPDQPPAVAALIPPPLAVPSAPVALVPESSAKPAAPAPKSQAAKPRIIKTKAVTKSTSRPVAHRKNAAAKPASKPATAPTP